MALYALTYDEQTDCILRILRTILLIRKEHGMFYLFFLVGLPLEQMYRTLYYFRLIDKLVILRVISY